MPTPQPLTIATYNLACGAKKWYGSGIPHIADFLKAQNVTIALCQEVDRHAKRSHFIDVPRQLEIHTGLTATFNRSITFPPEAQGAARRTFGNALLTSFDTLQTIQINLGPREKPRLVKHKGEAEPRTAIFAELATPLGVLWVAGTHLAYSPKRHPSAVRAAQVLKLYSAINTHVPTTAPFLLAGDFNAEAQNPDLAPLHQHLTHHPTNAPTFPLGRDNEPPHLTIDHIFTRNLTLTNLQTHPDPTRSDHAGLTAQISF